MANYTEHYNLEKPEKTDYYDVDIANKNNDIIDNKLYEKQDKQPGKGLSTNDFTNEYKKKIDALQRIYKYCGSIETITDLETIENKQRGDVYNVKDVGIDYCWNETEWTELGNAVDLSNYQTQEKAEQDKQQIEEEINQIQEDFSKCQEKTVPQGGTTGQVLSKNSDDDYDVGWVDKTSSYSTEEQVIGTWIDGREIYRKVVNFTMADTLNHWNNAAYVPCDIMISIKGFVIVNNGEWYPIPTAGGGEDVWFYFSRADNWLREKHNYDYANNQPCFLIIEYTKTTD